MKTPVLGSRNPSDKLLFAVGFFAVIGLIAALPGRGQDPRRRRPSEQRPMDQAQPASGTNSSKITAIVGGDIYTVTHEVIRRGTVLIKGDKIQSVGQNITVPAGATVIDATGKWVTPGFIAIDMSGIGLGGGPGGLGGPSGPNSRYADSLDPFDRYIKFALGAGITTGSALVDSRGSFGTRRRNEDDRFLGFEPTLPEGVELHDDEGEEGGFLHRHGSDEECDTCPCCGLAILPTEPITPPIPSAPSPRRYAVLKMSYGQLDPMLIDRLTFYDPGRGALTGALNRYNWRQMIERARKYVADQAAHERAVRSGQNSQPPRKPVTDEVIALVKKEAALRTRAESVDEIRDMLALAKELDYRLVLDGVTEGWLVATELSEADVPVVITPRNRRRPQPGREETSGSSIEAAGIFERTGVRFAVTALSDSVSLDGLPGRDLTSLPLEAAFAVRGGCRESTALAALTIVPAQLLGLSDRLGSIDAGKDADLLILNGPPLDYRTYVETAFVSGNACYERAKDRVYPVHPR